MTARAVAAPTTVRLRRICIWPTSSTGLPLKAALASLGCGNPTALAELRPGEVVLDLGSGGGIDVLLSARRVGATGFAYGLDMTDAMLELARRNAAEAGAQNVAFLQGEIAAIPLPDASVDVIVSNCVINLAPDKAPVFQEAFRVLKPGGRFAVSDIVMHGGVPVGLADTAQMRRDLSSWAGCIAGALTDAEYRAGLAAAGFTRDRPGNHPPLHGRRHSCQRDRLGRWVLTRPPGPTWSSASPAPSCGRRSRCRLRKRSWTYAVRRIEPSAEWYFTFYVYRFSALARKNGTQERRPWRPPPSACQARIVARTTTVDRRDNDYAIRTRAHGSIYTCRR